MSIKLNGFPNNFPGCLTWAGVWILSRAVRTINYAHQLFTYKTTYLPFCGFILRSYLLKPSPFHDNKIRKNVRS